MKDHLSFIRGAALIIFVGLIISCSDDSNTLITDTTPEPVVVDTAALIQSHVVMGNPSGAVKDTSFPNNYLMEKPEYVLSYNREKSTANWVAWHLDASWRGNTTRQNDFRSDNSLPAGWYRVLSTSYSGSGFDRGHICPSADRTSSRSANSATFLMTNMMPQVPENNQGPWADMENYLRSLLPDKEMYIYAGGYGTSGAVDNGHVNIPSDTWKIVVVLDKGEEDLSRVSVSTRVIAVSMPNDNQRINRNTDWTYFRTTVDYIESQTGYDFLSNVPESIQEVIESGVDSQ